MAQISYFWGGEVTGDCGPYSDDTFSDFISSLMQSDRTTQSVITGSLNELAVTNPGGTVIRVDTGRALVDGKLYENTAVVDFNVAAPGSGTNYYTLVLRKDFAAQTVRLALLGPSSADYPDVTQTDGTLWEVSLAEISITSAGVITITATAVHISIPMKVTASQLQDDAVSTSKILDNAVTAGKLAAGAVTETKILDSSVSANKLASDSVTAIKILAGCIDYTKLATALYPYTADGSLAFRSAAGVLSELAIGTQGFSLKSSGAIPLWQNALGAVIRFSAQSIASGALTDLTTYSSEHFDNGGFHDGTNPYLTIPEGLAGLYLLGGSGYWAAHATADRAREIYINIDSGVSYYGQCAANHDENSIFHLDVLMVRTLSEGQTIRPTVKHNTTVNLNFTMDYFWAIKIA
ncbi:MAG: hypothetical protein QUS07_07315 [Methanothrix sp.]|nr:hypothetical protein [Methanothrix sp.]